MKKPKFEQSKWDDDKGVIEGSFSDLRRDVREKREMKKDLAKKESEKKSK